jgi:hypothetical protein
MRSVSELLITPYTNCADEPTSCTTSCTVHTPDMRLLAEFTIVEEIPRHRDFLHMQWRVGGLPPMCCHGIGCHGKLPVDDHGGRGKEDLRAVRGHARTHARLRQP